MTTKKSVKKNSSRGAHSTTIELVVPARDRLNPSEGIALGLRVNMLEISNLQKVLGGVYTGSGCGSDSIIMHWRGRTAVVRGSDLFRVWVATFAPKDVERLPSSGSATCSDCA